MSEHYLPPIIKEMLEAALGGASVALRRRKNGVQVADKQDSSKISSGDYQAQQIIEAVLSNASPEIIKQLRSLGYNVDKIEFFMEESLDGTKHDFSKKRTGAYFIVDPIDGTIGYTQKHGNTEKHPWAVSISLEVDGKKVASVVYEAAKHEYGTSTTDFSAINPENPKGNLFWAHEGYLNAHELSSEKGFKVEAKNGDYTQTKNPSLYNLFTLDNPPSKFEIDYSNVRDHILGDSTKLESNVRPYIDSGSNSEKFVKDFGFKAGDYDDCYSIVAGAMRAATGRASSLFAVGYPWDVSAAELILKKSGTNVELYRINNIPEEKYAIIAGRDKAQFSRMKNALEKTNMVELPERSGFFSNIRNALGYVGLGWLVGQQENTPPNDASAEQAEQPQSPQAAYDTAPAETINLSERTIADLVKFPDKEKIMLAACTASGCDAVAYYQPDGHGGFAAEKIINLYPEAYYSSGKQPEFAAHILSFNSATHQTLEQTIASREYHIPVPVPDKDGKSNGQNDQISGIIVLHAPQEGFLKLQDNVNFQADNPHEAVIHRQAKLKMAENIVAAHQNRLTNFGRRIISQKQPETIDKKLAIFNQMIADNKETISVGSDQNDHVAKVTEIMDIVVEKILGKNKDDKQAQLIHALTELHDIGKSQIPSALLSLPEANKTAETEKFFVQQNHNHPLFTMLSLLLYPTEAKMTAAHHHGILRYSDDKLRESLGDDFEKYKIIKNNFAPEEISQLSYLMRICDVTSAALGRGQKPLNQIVQEMTEKSEIKDGQAVINPNSFHPDYLCLMISKGVFEAYAEQLKKPAEEIAALQKAQNETLIKFSWTQEKETKLLDKIKNDPLLVETAKKEVERSPTQRQ